MKGESMYTTKDIQHMLNECNRDLDLKDRILSQFRGSDRFDMVAVFEDGYYERFDRYDSDLCEQFITAYEKIKGRKRW